MSEQTIVGATTTAPTLDADAVRDIRQALHLTKAVGQITYLLLHSKIVTREMIEQDYKICTTATVTVHRVRRALKPLGITIHAMRLFGYWISDEDKAKLRDALKAHSFP